MRLASKAKRCDILRSVDATRLVLLSSNGDTSSLLNCFSIRHGRLFFVRHVCSSCVILPYKVDSCTLMRFGTVRVDFLLRSVALRDLFVLLRIQRRASLVSATPSYPSAQFWIYGDDIPFDGAACSYFVVKCLLFACVDLADCFFLARCSSMQHS